MLSMKIHVTATEGQRETFQVDPNCSVGSFKNLVEKTIHIPVAEQTISWSLSDLNADVLCDDDCSLCDAGVPHGCHLHVTYAVGGTKKCDFCDRSGFSSATLLMHVHSDHREQAFAFELSQMFETRSSQTETILSKLQTEIGNMRVELSKTREELSITQGELLKTQEELLRTQKHLTAAETKVNDLPRWVVKVLGSMELLDFRRENSQGATILSLAAEDGHLEAMKYLRSFLNDDEFTHADQQGNSRRCEWLSRSGAISCHALWC